MTWDIDVFGGCLQFSTIELTWKKIDVFVFLAKSNLSSMTAKVDASEIKNQEKLHLFISGSNIICHLKNALRYYWLTFDAVGKVDLCHYKFHGLW